MKNSIKAVTLASIFTLSLSAHAAGSKSDSTMLTECKTSVAAQIENLDNIKVAHVKSRRDVFKAKFRVSANGERSVVVCTIEGDQPVALSCAKGKACGVNTVAAK